MSRLLVPTAALFWGLQFAFLNPALALLLVALYGATPGEVGLVLAAYNASGFVASLLVPAWADRRRNYLRPLLACSVLTFALAVALAAATTLPLAVLALVVVGGPAGVGNSLLFAHLRAGGAPAQTVVNTRAVFSMAWVAGPPVATLVVGWFGERALLVALALIAVLNAVTTVRLLRRQATVEPSPAAATDGEGPLSRTRVAGLVVAFTALQATNAATVAVMSLFVTERLGLAVVWAGIALGVTAAVEIPALLLVGRATRRFRPRTLIVAGCVLGFAYYCSMALLDSVVWLIAVQVLNAGFFAVVAGVGLTLFQEVIDRPGLATGIYTNARRIGSIVAGPIVALGAATSWGWSGVFVACAGLTVVGLVLVVLVLGTSRKSASVPSG